MTLLLPALSATCTSVTTAPDTLHPTDQQILVQLLPKINRDLKICDLVKEENALLNIKTSIFQKALGKERQATETARQQYRQEKRKRTRANIVRTIAEVAVIIFIIMI